MHESNIFQKLISSPKIKIICADFENTVASAVKEDFIYFDPPYKPVSTTASFTSYSAKSFGDVELERLASLCKNLAKKGCNVMTTNSDLPEVAKIFGGGWKIFHVAANRAINSNASRRTGHKELLLKNY